MTYLEILNKAKELNLSISKLKIAYECDNALDFEYTDQEFNDLCDFVYNIYINSDDIQLEYITYCINDLIRYGWKPKQITQLDIQEFFDKTSYNKILY